MMSDEAGLPVAVRAGTGWQTLMADLSIILFMVAASVVSRTTDALPAPPAATPRPAPASPSPQGEPLALYRDEPGAPPLDAWLAGQTPDRRQQLTITARYPPGGQARAMARAQALTAAAGAAGMAARIVVEPAAGAQGRAAQSDVTAALAYDVPSR